MMIFKTANEAAVDAAKLMRRRRLELNWSQVHLAEKANVSVSVLRKFERSGQISLESFLKLALVMDLMDKLLHALEPLASEASSLDELLRKRNQPERRRASSHGS